MVKQKEIRAGLSIGTQVTLSMKQSKPDGFVRGADVLLILTDDGNRKYAAHSAFLAAHSKVLCDLFYNSDCKPEAVERGKKAMWKIPLPNATAKQATSFLKFVYAQGDQELTVDDALSMAELLHRLDCAPALQKLDKCMTSGCKPKTWVSPAAEHITPSPFPPEQPLFKQRVCTQRGTNEGINQNIKPVLHNAACMQDLIKKLQRNTASAVDVLAKADEIQLPNVEHFIAKSFRRIPLADLSSISQAACLRILRAVSQQRDDAIDDGYCGTLPGADTMLKWR